MTTAAILPISNQFENNPREETLQLKIFDKFVLKASCFYLVEDDHAAIYEPQAMEAGYLSKMVNHLKSKYGSVVLLYVQTEQEKSLALKLKKANLISDALDNDYESIF
ncbi:hypothetical protein [Photobacterium damselae]|uniref:hypothetical protein n=1 Tax=Photobacterium damselae TaxID=38293 RepID=UPI001F1A1943|nr:hypothetical protein [Photobacterium damselae]UKA04447.1 hypothetical protein IHC89_22760 [Photobacterium damselae subsp. damselae]